MKTIIRFGLPLLAAAQLWAMPNTGTHPGFTLQSLRPASFNPMVSGIDFMSDGRMVMTTWDGFGKGRSEVYLISGFTSGDASKVTVKTFYKGPDLNEVLGVKVVDDKIYVLEKDALTYLPDANHDDSADAVQRIATGWKIQSDPKLLEFAMGMVFKDSAFYGGLATAWPLDGNQSDERGCVIKIPFKGGSWAPYACGMRTPNGLLLGPDGEIFTTENQGNWVPSSKLLHIMQGHFYGVHKSKPGPGPFDNAGETPPAIWMDHGNISISPTQPVFLTSGIFKGQMIAGDNNAGTLQRYFLEKVGGEYQGAILPFTGGLEAAANRIMTGPDGAIYVGGLGTDEWGGWWWNSKRYGLQRLTPNGKSFFDILAVRSLGATKMEIEFTGPAGASAASAANYKVQTWNYTPQFTYGAGKGTASTLNVKSVTASDDKTKVTIEIDGMKAKYVVYFKLSNVTSAANEQLWSTEAWYTQNAFGPGVPVTVPTSAVNRSAAPSFSMRPAAGGRWSLSLPGSGAYTLEILDLKGRVLETAKGSGPSEITTRGAYRTGLFMARVHGPEGAVSSRILCAGK
jgi:cytochrome c